MAHLGAGLRVASLMGAALPELPEVETVRRGLAPTLEGALIVKAEVRRPDLRFPFPEGLADRLSGARVLALTRRAKYLLLETDRQETFILHLGMSGSYRVVADPVLGQNREIAPTLAQGASSQQQAVSQPGVFYHKRDMIQTHDHLVLDVQDTKDLRSAVIYNDPRRF
ncbi:MAG: DNA-formamidopyrimidine glycosylase family protein, partial [Pseudomonadota bacterium]